MLPLRIELEGFLTYREPTVLDFRGEWLWAITGPNGAGKSAIFDAITFVLYGEHRGGKQHDEKLISQGSDRLRVAFDFAVDEDGYRVERVLNRRRRGTGLEKSCQAWQIDPDEAEPTTAVRIPNTSDTKGLEAWVERTVGLSLNAFVSSVLLRQGEADLFIRAKPADRKRVLIEMLDLLPYEKMAQAATLHARAAAAREQELAGQLEGLAEATPAAVEAANARCEDLRQQEQAAQGAVENAITAEGNAKRFADLSPQITAKRKGLSQIAETLARAETIERDYAELVGLQGVLPVLTEIHRHRGAASAAQQRAAELSAEADAIDVEGLEQTRAACQQLEDEADSAYQRARQATADCRTEIATLKPLADAAREVDQLEKQCALAATRRQQLEAELTAHDAAKAHRDRCQVAAQAAPTLQTLQQRRAAARQYEAKRQAAEADARDLDDAVRAGEAAVAELREQAKAARDQEQQGRLQLVSAETELRQARAEYEGRLAAKDEGICSRCGQPIDGDHIRREIERAQAQVDTLAATVRDLTKDVEARAHTARDLGEQVTQREQKVRETEKARDTARARERADAGLRDDAVNQAVQAQALLPEPYQTLAAREDWPSEAEAREVATLASQQTEAQEACSRLDGLSGTLTNVRQQIDQWTERLATIRACHPGADFAGALVRDEALASLVEQRASAEETAGKDWTAARDATKQAVVSVDEATDRRRVLLERAGAATSLAQAAETAATALRGGLDAHWLAEAAELDGARLTSLKERMLALGPAAGEKEELDAGRRDERTLRGQLEVLEEQLAEIPEGDRIPVQQAAEQIEEARRIQREQHDQFVNAETHAATVQEQMSRRQDLEQQASVASTRREDYALLARLLGKDGLQAWLIQAAQAAIAETANAFLGDMSGGLLRLTMQPQKDELEILVTDLSSGQDPMDIAFISGSQRFRVAVAIALAIGQYSGSGSHNIHSVIIDEGFGSLDTDGRREMTGQLKSLEGILERIILVSHQEAFLEAFPVGYHIEKVDGVSRATRRSGDRNDLWASEPLAEAAIGEAGVAF